MSLIVNGLTKRFGALAALDDVSLSVARGAFLALLGPSGSGKTTLLRVLGGLEHAAAGTASYEGQDWLGVPARERRVGFVFQHYALFRHMTVASNVAFGLKVRPRGQRPNRVEIGRRVNELLALMQLEELGKRYPSQLSGGQRQRVALARALAIEPKLLLLDEPFGALDAKVRKDLRRWLRGLHEQLGLTTIFVTHDQEEALDLADQVAVMNEGRIEQVGSPLSVYGEPKTAFVAEFLGGSNRIEGRISDRRFIVGEAAFPFARKLADSDIAVAFIRPHEFAFAHADEPALQAVVTNILAAGAVLRVDCRRTNGEVLEVALAPSLEPPQPGSIVRLTFPTHRIYPLSPRPNS